MSEEELRQRAKAIAEFDRESVRLRNCSRDGEEEEEEDECGCEDACDCDGYCADDES